MWRIFICSERTPVLFTGLDIANTLRGKMDADDFRDYILGFIFYKYLSKKMELYANEILEPDNLKFRDLEGHAQETEYLDAV